MGPAEFLYEATICLFQSAYGIITNIVQLITLLATVSSGEVDSACESIVHTLGDASGSVVRQCDVSSICLAMGPAALPCDIVFLGLCISSYE
jgi:hypothetical protein|eukprot:COSAG06_NODE_234_length_19567_cov_23.768595_15_plen_92_part_00